jgi:hypothetical protein
METRIAAFEDSAAIRTDQGQGRFQKDGLIVEHTESYFLTRAPFDTPNWPQSL